MKKVLVLMAIAIVSLSVTAGVATIQPQQKDYEAFVLDTDVRPVMVFHSFTYEVYDLVVYSDNSLETRYASIELGSTLEEALESLKNLADACDLQNNKFKLEEYQCFTTTKAGGIYIINSIGELSGTAGYYYIPKKNLLRLIEKMKTSTPL